MWLVATILDYAVLTLRIRLRGPIQKSYVGTSLVVQWLGIRLPMQGTWVRARVREDPTCLGAAKPVRHNY